MQSRKISTTIRELSEERKQNLREEIRTRTAISRLLGKNINNQALAYTMDLLDGNTPTPMGHRNNVHRNGKVIIIKEGGN